MSEQGRERALLEGAYWAALAAVAPAQLLAPHLSGPPPDRVLAFGKAALPMVRAACAVWPGLRGLAVPPDSTPDLSAPDGIQVIPGGHPLPTSGSVRAARRALALVGALPAGARLLVLVSGGGSALLAAPQGVTLAQTVALTRELLRAGADITEINTVRKHLSGIKGGRLAAATRAQVTALLLSDVVGDDPATIASGPTVPDATTYGDALAVLERYGIHAPGARAALIAGARGESPETPKPGSLPHASHMVIGSNRHLLAAASAHLEGQGIRTLVVPEPVVGDVQAVAQRHAALIWHHRGCGPLALISGGEATVQVRGDGVGGRNSEFALRLLHLLGENGVWALAAGSDGIDGRSDAAGAFLTPDSLRRARAAGLDLADHLRRNDSGTVFAALGDAFVTGPTGHNLNDLSMVLLT